MLDDLFVLFLIVGQRVQNFELHSPLFVLEQEFDFLFYFAQFLIAVLDQAHTPFEGGQGVFEGEISRFQLLDNLLSSNATSNFLSDWSFLAISFLRHFDYRLGAGRFVGVTRKFSDEFKRIDPGVVQRAPMKVRASDAAGHAGQPNDIALNNGRSLLDPKFRKMEIHGI